MAKAYKNILFLSCIFLNPVFSVLHQMCDIKKEIDRERDTCEAQNEEKSSGCAVMWDKITCWPSAEVGEVVTIPCPKYLFYFSKGIHIQPLQRRAFRLCALHHFGYKRESG